MSKILDKDSARSVRDVIKGSEASLRNDAKRYGLDLTDSDVTFLIRKLSRLVKSGLSTDHVKVRLTEKTQYLFQLIKSQRE